MRYITLLTFCLLFTGCVGGFNFPKFTFGTKVDTNTSAATLIKAQAISQQVSDMAAANIKIEQAHKAMELQYAKFKEELQKNYDDMVKNQYPGYQPSSICSDFAHPSKPETTIPVESSSIVNDTIQSCVQKGIKGQANCATEILNCCASNKLLTQPNAMQQCYDGATSFCAKNNTLEGFELTKQKPKNKGNDCSMWKMLINIVLIGLLIYLGYLLFEEMSKKSPEDVGTAPTPTGAV